MLGPIDSTLPQNRQGTLFYTDVVTETPKLNTAEVWEFHNTTVDAHPVHMHLVDFRVLNRQPFTINGGDPNASLQPKDMGGGYTGGIVNPKSIGMGGAAVPAPAWEDGKKDTVVTFPGQVTRVMATFRRTGSYVYHCHILSHEDHEMMRPYQVVP
jgi:spore coat protein A